MIVDYCCVLMDQMQFYSKFKFPFIPILTEVPGTGTLLEYNLPFLSFYRNL